MILRISRKAVVFLSASVLFSVWSVNAGPATATLEVSHNAEAELRRRTRQLQGTEKKGAVERTDYFEDTNKRKSKHLKTRDTGSSEEKAKTREKGLKSRSRAKPPTEVGKFTDKQTDRQATLLPLGTVNPSGENSVPQATGGCQLNENGLYGLPDALSDVYTVQYLYQTSVFAGTSMTQLENSVIQDVDNAITTAILPSFFDCARTIRQRRHLQGGVVQAISSEPIDSFISSGLTCSKLVDNSDCYVVQGLSTVIATGFRDIEELEIVFKEAVQIALQGNAILSNVDTSLILDVSALSDDLQTLPPVIAPVSTPTIPVSPAPVPVLTLAPFDLLSPPPVVDLTFAPVPALPTRPIVEATEAPVALPQLIPSVPTVSTGAPVTPVAPPAVAGVPTSPVAPTSPVVSPVADIDRDPSAEGGGLEWWAWLFAIVAGGLLALCCLMMFRSRGSSPAAPIGKKKQRRRPSAKTKEDAARRDDTDDPPYEPPPSSTGNSYIPPGIGTFSITPPEPDLVVPSKEEPSPPALFVNTAPTFVSDTPDYVDDEPEFVNDTQDFVNNNDAYDDEEEEEEEERTESYSEDVDEGIEEDEGVDDDYDDEEDDDDQDEVEEVEAEAFEDEGSFYEEEELFEHESQQSENWGNPPQQYNSRF